MLLNSLVVVTSSSQSSQSHSFWASLVTDSVSQTVKITVSCSQLSPGTQSHHLWNHKQWNYSNGRGKHTVEIKCLFKSMSKFSQFFSNFEKKFPFYYISPKY